jgi:uncharacterized protein (TIGR02186 family)
MKTPLFLCFIFCLLFNLSLHAKEPTGIIAALDDHLVAIDTGFSGSKVLLFGTREADGDVIVIVRGPSRKEIVRKQDRIMGVWANRQSVSFTDTPSFYNIAASKNISDLVSEEIAQQLELGPEHLNSYLAPESKSVSAEERKLYWDALLRNKKRDGLYSNEYASVQFLGKNLFRTDFLLPSNIPIGTYLVYVYLVKDKKVVNSQITPLFVSKTGLEAGIYDFAQRHSFSYGMIAVIIALIAGWSGSVIFRKK